MKKQDAFTCLIPGKLLHERPGKPSLYPGIADEAFLRGIKYNPQQNHIFIYDPFCGVGGGLVSPAVIRHANIARIFGSDVEPETIVIAQKNLELCSLPGYDSATESGTKVPNGKAVDPQLLLQFREMLMHYGCTQPIEAHFFVHAMPAAIPKDIIATESVSMIITDPPYGQMSPFVGDHAQPVDTDALLLRYMDSLRAIRPLLRDKGTVTIVCDKRQQIEALLAGMPEFDYREGRSSKGQNFRRLHTLQAK